MCSLIHRKCFVHVHIFKYAKYFYLFITKTYTYTIYLWRYICFYTKTKKKTPALDILDDIFTFENRLLAHAQIQLPFHVNNCSLFQRWLPNTWSRWDVVNLTVLYFLQICSLLLSGMRLSALKILFKVGKHEFINFEKEMA